ncbi:hypothetical protein ACP4OV_015862 [Aristida adscensionis]
MATTVLGVLLGVWRKKLMASSLELSGPHVEVVPLLLLVEPCSSCRLRQGPVPPRRRHGQGPVPPRRQHGQGPEPPRRRCDRGLGLRCGPLKLAMVHNTVASLQSHTITSEMPPDIPWHVIRDITNDFSEERQIGRGGYGVVYKGVHEKGREVAVKKLYHMPGLDEMQYQSEIQNLEGLYHPNIVRLVGKSYIEQDRCVEYKGKLVFATMIDRAICLEYVPNGSLEKHLYDEFSGFSWTARYKIIKGICLGLEYLHQRRIFHLDLKPANILLDQDMLPKIADFGLSRIFSGTRQSHTTNKFIGTIGYLPPEYIEKGKISEKFDVFSLGVIIIKLLTGPDVYGLHSDLSSEEFIEQVHGNWKKRLEKNGLKDASYLDALCQQVKTCIEMAINCVQTDRHKRPRIRDIIHILNGTETTFDETYKQLFVIQPQSLCFPFRPDMLIPCPLQITNNMDQGIAFRIRPKIPNLFVRSSLHGYVTARSTHTHILVIEKQQKPMLLNPDSIVIQSSVEGLDPSDWRDDTKVIHHDEIKEVRQTSLQDINPDSIVSQSSVEGLDPSDWRDDLKVIHHDEIKEVRQLTSEVRPLRVLLGSVWQHFSELFLSRNSRNAAKRGGCDLFLERNWRNAF